MIKIQNQKKSQYLIIAGLIGCGFCCLPLLLPISAGLFGASLFSFSFAKWFWGVVLLIISIVLVGIYRAKKRKKVCDLAISTSKIS